MIYPKNTRGPAESHYRIYMRVSEGNILSMLVTPLAAHGNYPWLRARPVVGEMFLSPPALTSVSLWPCISETQEGDSQHFCLLLLPTHKGTGYSQGFSSSLYNSHGEIKFFDWWNISGMRKFPAPLPSQLITGLHQYRILGITISPSSWRFLPSVIQGSGRQCIAMVLTSVDLFIEPEGQIHFLPLSSDIWLLLCIWEGWGSGSKTEKFKYQISDSASILRRTEQSTSLWI